MSARETAHVVVRAGALALLAACGGGSPLDAGTGDGADVQMPHVCSPSVPPMPVTHIGPDLTLRADCEQQVASAFASVAERGAGVTSWSVHLESATAAFSLGAMTTFKTCQSASGASIAAISFQPPRGAVPGDTFDAVVTVHADDGSFADGTVNVHGEVIKPIVTIDPPTVEFGDVPPGFGATRPLVFLVANNLANSISPSPVPAPPFGLQMLPFTRAQAHASSWIVAFNSNSPGDYSAAVPFATTHNPARPPACEWTTTVKLHARVVGDGGAPDGGADAEDDP